jgi:hypothetical protein
LAPVGVISGSQTGPTLWIQATSHGEELLGAAAISKLFQSVRPAELKGTVVALPVVNVVGFTLRERFSPVDGMDLNRVWPGAEPQSVMNIRSHSEVVVHEISKEIKRNAQYLLDLHDGGYDLDHAPFCGYFTNTGDKELDTKTSEIALASGMTVLCPAQPKSDILQKTIPGSVRTFTAREGIPAVTLEVADVDHHLLGITNIMRYLGMMPGSPKKLGDQIQLSGERWVRSNRGGILWAKVRVLDKVSRGQPVATVTSLFGETIDDINSPVDGIVSGIKKSPGLVNMGEYVVNLGVFQA